MELGLVPSFVIFFISGIAETNRAPFDLVEAESEIVGGYHTEYSGFRFAMFFLAEYINIFNISAITVTLFLGGWHGPTFGLGAPFDWLLPIFWFLAKTTALIFVFVWVRATLAPHALRPANELWMETPDPGVAVVDCTVNRGHRPAPHAAQLVAVRMKDVT